MQEKLLARYIAPQVTFGTGGTAWSSGLYTGRYFTAGSSTLNIATGGVFKALFVDSGLNGDNATNDYVTFAGVGGRGGLVRTVLGYIPAGAYTVTVGGLGSNGTVTTLTPTSYTNAFSTSFTPGNGGSTFLGSQGNGGNGPNILMPPFTGITVSGGGGGGGSVSGSAAIGITGGIGQGGSKSALSTSFGSGGGGGGTGGGIQSGGSGGPGYFLIVSLATPTTADITSVTNISGFTMSSTYTLSDILNNSIAVRSNPNSVLVPVTCIPNISNYINSYQYNEVSVSSCLNSLGYKQMPFTMSGGTYYISYFNGYFTLVFPNTGTFTMTTNAILSPDIVVVGNGGTGSGYGGSGSNNWGAGGGSGGVTRGKLTSLASGSVITIRANTSASYGGTTYAWGVSVSTSYLAANNGGNGVGYVATSAATVQGANGTTATPVGFTSVAIGTAFGSYSLYPTTTATTFNDGIKTNNTTGIIGVGLGGRGAPATLNPTIGRGGFYGSSNAGPNTGGNGVQGYGLGYGAGGGVVLFGTGAGVPGVIMISIAY